MQLCMVGMQNEKCQAFAINLNSVDRPHPGQHFAATSVSRHGRGYTSTLDGKKTLLPGVDLLILESTGEEDHAYRRVGLSMISVLANPDPDDVNVRPLTE